MPAALRATLSSVSSVSGDVHTQVLTPRILRKVPPKSCGLSSPRNGLLNPHNHYRLRNDPLLPDRRVSGEVLAAEACVVPIRHSVILLQRIRQLGLGDRLLREHPLLRDFLTGEDLLHREKGGAPLEVRV